MSLGYLATSTLNILHDKKEENAGLCIADEKCFGILLKGLLMQVILVIQQLIRFIVCMEGI